MANKKNNSFRALLQKLDPSPSTPGRISRAFRKNFGLTLKEMEEITGIKEANLSKLENNKLEMTSQYAEKIAAVFGLHPRLILYPEGWDIKTEKYKSIAVKAQSLIKRKVG